MGSAFIGILAALALFGQIETSRPDVRPLEARFRLGMQERQDGTWKRGFFLSTPLRVGHWMIFSIERTRRGVWGGGSVSNAKEAEERPTRTSRKLDGARWRGLLAYDLESGRAIQLIPPRPSKAQERVSWVTEFYRWGQDRCAVVMTQFQMHGAKAERVLGEYLWELNLDKNTLSPVGRWDDAKLLQLVLDPRLVEAVVISTDAAGAQTVEIRDKQTGRRTQFIPNGSVLLEPDGGGELAAMMETQTIIPQADRRSFVVYSPTSQPPNPKGSEARFDCVDPRSQNGRRWTLTTSELRKTTDQEFCRVYPVSGLSCEPGRVAIVLASATSQESLVIVDGQTGHVQRVVRLPRFAESEQRDGLILSPDGVRAAYISVGKRQGRSSSALVIVDTKTGLASSRTDFDRRLTDQLIAFDDRGRILDESRDALARMTVGNSPSFERLFALDPSATGRDQRFTAAGLRELRDLNSLTSLVLSRTEISGATLVELGRLNRLQRLKLDIAFDAAGDLNEIGRLTNVTSLVLADNHLNATAYRQLGQLGNLTQLDLQLFGRGIPEVGLEPLGKLTNLVSLRLSGPFRDHLKLASFQRLKKLKSLQLDLMTIEDDDLETLSKLTELAHLDIRADVTVLGLRKLKQLPKLVDLSLSLNRIGDFDGIVTELGTFPHLTRLRLADENTLSRNVLKQLGGLRNLTELDLHSFGVDFSSGSLEGLAECQNLTQLHLTDYTLKADDLREILKLSKLTHLDLSSTSVAEVDLRMLAELRKLEELDLYSAESAFDELTDTCLAGLRDLTNLKSLRISGNPISDVGLQQLSSLKHLKRLQMAHAPITDRGLKSLKPLEDLADLDLYDTEITDVGLSELRGLRKLSSLELGATQITNAGMKQLTFLSALRRLNLEATSITDAGLKDVAAIESLEELDLSATAVSDAGLKQLKRLTKLRSLALRRTAVTDAGLRQLKALPNLSTLTLGR